MEGEISCQSEPGKGSRFLVDLELERLAQQAQKKKNASLDKSVVDLKVLLVDDNAFYHDRLIFISYAYLICIKFLFAY